MKPAALAPLFVLCGLSLSAVALAEGSAEKGESKSTACIACHGPSGNSVNPEWPNLAGQGQAYIHKQLQAFKGGARKNPLMTPMAAGLSDEDMADLGAYFAAQKPTGLDADPGKLAVGQRVYRAGDPKTGVPACAACHGPAGDGNPPAAYPALRGQYATYAQAQLDAFRQGHRRNDVAAVMREIAGSLSEQEIAAVSAYLESVRP